MLDTHRLEPRSRPPTCDARVLVTGRIGFRHPTRNPEPRHQGTPSSVEFQRLLDRVRWWLFCGTLPKRFE